jgi:antitoxin component HigA of HigAB toxin-antitoxin module
MRANVELGDIKHCFDANKSGSDKNNSECPKPPSRASEILAGTKQMNVSHMVKLSAIFGVEPAVFLPKGKK